jgi:hypothetical protein
MSATAKSTSFQDLRTQHGIASDPPAIKEGWTTFYTDLHSDHTTLSPEHWDTIAKD